jgi:hypothetical protein
MLPGLFTRSLLLGDIAALTERTRQNRTALSKNSKTTREWISFIILPMEDGD